MRIGPAPVPGQALAFAAGFQIVIYSESWPRYGLGALGAAGRALAGHAIFDPAESATHPVCWLSHANTTAVAPFFGEGTGVTGCAWLLPKWPLLQLLLLLEPVPRRRVSRHLLQQLADEHDIESNLTRSVHAALATDK